MLGVPRLAVPQICYTWKLEEASKLVPVLLAVTIENLKKKNECEKNSKKVEKHILKRRGELWMEEYCHRFADNFSS